MKVRLTQHAVERYQERVRPTSGAKNAREELTNMIPVAEVTQEPPEWAQRVRDDADFYLVLGDVALVVINDYAVTCLTKGTLPPRQRKARNDQRTKRRARKRRVGNM